MSWKSYELEYLQALGIRTEGRSPLEVKLELNDKLQKLTEERRRKERQKASLQDCGLEEPLSRTEPELIPRELLLSLQNFFKGGACFFLLRGGVGLNKTRYLLDLGRRLYNHLTKQLTQKYGQEAYPSSKELYFLSWTKFLSELDDFESRRWKETLDKAVLAKVLLIDDFFSGYLSPYRINQVWILINERYGSGKKTVISTNEDLWELRKNAQGDVLRILDRLCDQNMSVEYVLQGESLRTGQRLKEEGEKRQSLLKDFLL